MRRRDIISGVLTIVLLALTCKHWLIFKPMPVSFLVKGNGSYTFTVQLNKKNNNEFKKIKQCTIKKHLTGGYEKCECKIDRVRFPKRLRLVVNTSDVSPIEIKDITLKNGKYKLPSVSEFALHNALPGGGGDILMPSSSTFTLTYNEKLSVRSGIKFEAMTFIIIAVLGYLLSYKLTSYLADFKVLSNYSRLDILFLLVCTILMFLPMSHITNDVKSIAENRELAKWVPLINKDKINYNFGKDFDNWFNDRYNFRRDYVNLYGWLRYYFSKYSCINNGVLLNKQNHWFLILKFHKAAQKLFTPEQQRVFSEDIKILSEYCDKTRKKLYFVIIPEKGILYKDEIYEGLISNPLKVYDPVPDIIKNVYTASGVEILYPYDELMKAKKEHLVFFKHDHHLNDVGYLVVFNSLIKRMNADGVPFPQLRECDFTVQETNKARSGSRFSMGSGFCTLNIWDETLLDETYKFYTPKCEHPLQKKVLIIGDSYVNMTKPLFFNMFQTVDSIFVRGLAQAERKDVLRKNLDLLKKADVVVMMFSAIQPEMLLDMDFDILRDARKEQ